MCIYIYRYRDIEGCVCVYIYSHKRKLDLFTRKLYFNQ